MARVRRGAALVFLLVASWSCAPDAVLAPPPESGGAGGTGGIGGEGGDGGMGGAGGSEPPACFTPHTDIPTGDCSLLFQDCPPPDRCTVGEIDGSMYLTVCEPPKGGLGAGESCVESECEYGLSCVFGRCSPACCPGNNYPCGDQAVCLATQSYGPHFVRRCAYLTPCELFMPGVCRAAEPPGACHVLIGHGVTSCLPPSGLPGVDGTPCSFQNKCGDSLTCWPPEGAGTVCRHNCWLDGSGTGLPGGGGCPAGQTCTDVDLGVANVGLCLP